MVRLEAHQLIHKPAAAIFDFLITPENHPKFVPGMLEFRVTSASRLAQVGATARGVRRLFWRKVEMPYQITEHEPDRRLAMKGKIGPIEFDDGYVLEAMGASTRVNFWLEPRITGLMKLAQPLIVFMGRAHAAETLGNLRKVLETTAS